MSGNYETCEDCWKDVEIMKMIVKGTSDGICIYCPECMDKQKKLYEEIRKIYNIDFEKM